MRWFVVLAVLMLNCPVAVGAGPWLRERGAGFGAASLTVRQVEPTGLYQYDSSILLEYGLRSRLTLGFDANTNLSGAGHALAFARIPLISRDRPLKLALDFGLGGHRTRSAWHGMGKTTLSVGRGFELAGKPGWVAVDAAVEWRAGDGAALYKLDATFGLSPSERWKTILSLESFAVDGGGSGWAVIPTLGFSGFGDKTLTAGIEIKQTNRRSYGLKLGIWHEF